MIRKRENAAGKERDRAGGREAPTRTPGVYIRAPYLAPRLEHLGNVRDVLGKTGPTRDVTRINPRRP